MAEYDTKYIRSVLQGLVEGMVVVLGLSETVLGKEHLDTTGEHEQHDNRCLAVDAVGSQGNYEHGEEMQ